MIDKLVPLDVRCPLLVDKNVDRRNERCLGDCAWLLTDGNGYQVCAVAILAAAQSKWSVRSRFDDFVVGGTNE